MPAEVWLTGLVSLGVEVVRMGVKDLFTAWEEHSYQQEHIIIDIYCVYHYILLWRFQPHNAMCPRDEGVLAVRKWGWVIPLPSLEDDFRWKTTFCGRRPSVEDDLRWIFACCLLRFATFLLLGVDYEQKHFVIRLLCTSTICYQYNQKVISKFYLYGIVVECPWLWQEICWWRIQTLLFFPLTEG